MNTRHGYQSQAIDTRELSSRHQPIANQARIPAYSAYPVGQPAYGYGQHHGQHYAHAESHYSVNTQQPSYAHYPAQQTQGYQGYGRHGFEALGHYQGQYEAQRQYSTGVNPLHVQYGPTQAYAHRQSFAQQPTYGYHQTYTHQPAHLSTTTSAHPAYRPEHATYTQGNYGQYNATVSPRHFSPSHLNH